MSSLHLGLNEYQKKIKCYSRHGLIYEQIQKEHNTYGYNRTVDEIKNKIGNLKSQYSRVKPKSGGTVPSWPFFTFMDRVLGQKHTIRQDIWKDSLDNESSDNL